MTTEFTLQDPGEGIHEAEILEVLVSEGDSVEEGQDVLVVETDKAAIEIPSPQAGTIASVAVGEGDIVSVGDVLLTFEDGGSEARAKSDDEDEEAPEQASEREADASEDSEAEAADDDEEKKAETKKSDEIDEDDSADRESFETDDPSVAARMKAGDEDESDEAGREAKADDTEKKAARDDAEAKKGGEGPVPATPAVRRIARELNVELSDVEGTGPEGRVTEDDVRKAAGEETSEKKPARDEKPAGDKPETPTGLPDFARWGEVERVKLRSVRRATARRMSKAWAEIPHVAHQDRADITALEDFRKRHEAEIEEEGGALTLTVFLLKAAAAALREYPRFNASLDTVSDEIVLKRYCHIGMALDSERGLLVPVFRDVDRKSVSELAVELKQLTKKARDGKAEPEDMRGGSFTLTNVGGIGGTAMMPIINHPQVAILGAARARREPVIVDGPDQPADDPVAIEARLMLPLTLTFDHRVADGAEAARFMNTVIEALGDPETFALTA